MSAESGYNSQRLYVEPKASLYLNEEAAVMKIFLVIYL